MHFCLIGNASLRLSLGNLLNHPSTSILPTTQDLGEGKWGMERRNVHGERGNPSSSMLI